VAINDLEPVVVPQEQIADFQKLREAQLDAASQHGDAFSDEFAVEVEGVRGEKRIDHEKVRIRNADGTLNKAGRAWMDITDAVDKVEEVIGEKIRANDYEPDPVVVKPRVEALGRELEDRVAKQRGLVRVKTPRDAHGHPLVLWGRGLFRDAQGRYRRLVAYYGSLREYEA
jgi:hypothetical protein